MKLQGKTLMIVAHPDDEVIFGFDTLNDNPECHVICLTNGDNPERATAFANLFKGNLKQVTGEIWSYRDEPVDGFTPVELIEIAETLKEIAAGYNNIVTHDWAGEYGHTQHKQVSEVVSALAGNKNLYHFCTSNILSYSTLMNKLNILWSIYSAEYHKGTFDWVDPKESTNRMMDWIACGTIKKVN